MEIDSKEEMYEEYVEQATRNDMELDELVLIVARTSVYYHNNFLVKQPCRNSPYTGWKFVRGIIERNDRRCHEMFQMEKHVFVKLCDRSRRYGLISSKGVRPEEMIVIEEQFQHSSETVSRQFHCVLEKMMMLAFDEIKPPKNYDDCIGAINGTHIRAKIPMNEQISYIGRKGFPTQNIMAVCDFDMLFTFVYVIERCFGVWKARRRILANMPPYKFDSQVAIVIASMILHNFIRREAIADIEFESHEENKDHVPDNDESYINPTNDDNETRLVRDKIARELVL
ncbi:hypothetical protein UlMin_013592 [Ulmus minor]